MFLVEPSVEFRLWLDKHISFETDCKKCSCCALLLDVVLVGIVKALVRRRRPSHNRMDMFATFSVDRYSFPSGHATRAAMGARFLLTHLVLAAPVRVLVLLWAVLVGLSRVMLGRHNVTDVAFGFLMGYFQYSLVEALWVSTASLQQLLGVLE
ncbi:PLPP6 phosphatase, partial [Polyodon spathula]|nr:PLPP6 phosphatase [Polyodon spathula]